MDGAVHTTGGQFELTEDQRAIQAMAEAFAAERVAPAALEWDRNRHFPADVIRETGPLGLGGIYVRDDVGGIRTGQVGQSLARQNAIHQQDRRGSSALHGDRRRVDGW